MAIKKKTTIYYWERSQFQKPFPIFWEEECTSLYWVPELAI